MRKLLYSFLLISHVAAGQDFGDAVDEIAAAHANAGLFSGVILIAHADEVVFERGYGFANWELRVENSSVTRLGIGSITKSMTANIAHALIADGRIESGDPVEKYIPDFPRGPAGGVATVEHLLNHRAGVPHRVTNVVEESQPLSTGDIVAKVAGRGLLYEPGTDRLYSSAGYTTLARVLELASGQTFDQLLDRYVFGPAQMTTARNETGQMLLARRALPYRLGASPSGIVVKNAPFKDLRFLTGAGSVYATVVDLHRYVRAIEMGVFGEQARSDLNGDDPLTWRGIYGRTNGYEASVDVLAGEQMVIILLSNLQSASTGQVRAQLQSLVSGDTVSQIPLPPRVAEPFEDALEIIGAYGRAVISQTGGVLFRGENEFFPTEEQTYYIPASGTEMVFRRGADGVVDALLSTSLGGRTSVLSRDAD